MELGTTAIQGKARQLINDIANGHTLNGTIFGTQLEQVINNCLEMYVAFARPICCAFIAHVILQPLRAALRKEHTLPAGTHPKRRRQRLHLFHPDFKLHIQAW
jgi:hypothetical protein